MRAGEPPGAEADRADQGVDHPRGAGLAVGAGQVHHRIGLLGLAEQLGEGGDPVQRGLEAGLGPAGQQGLLGVGVGRGGSGGGGVRHRGASLGAPPLPEAGRPGGLLVRCAAYPDRRISGHEHRVADPRPVRDDRRPGPRGRRTGQACAGGARGDLVRALEGRRHLRVRPDEDPRAGLLHRHPSPDRLGVPPRRARVLLHAHRPGGALPADARQGGLLPDGLGRQRPAHRAPGAELLRRPLRPLAAVRRGLHPAREAGPEEAGPDQPAELRRAVRAARRAGRAGLRVAVAHPRPLRRLEAALHDRRREVPDRVAAGVPAQLRPRRGLPAGVPDPVGRHLPDRGRAGRARGPRVRRRLPPGRLPPARRRAAVHRDHPSRADPRGRGADRAPRRRALPVAVRYDGHLPGLRRRGAGRRAPGRRAGQGRRHRDVLHLRRPDRRHLVARAPAAGAHRDRPRRPAAPRDPRVAGARARRDGVRGAGRQDHVQRPRGGRRCAACVRRPRRRAEADPADDELLREGRQAARDRLHAAVVHQERRPGRRAARRADRARRGDPRGCRRT